jgi:hypothetical protein
MLYEVDFLVPGACRHEKPKVVETVQLNHHGQLDGNFWISVQRMLKARSSLDETVDKWLNASACDLKKRTIGLTVVTYEAARHPYTGKVERCRTVRRQRS